MIWLYELEYEVDVFMKEHILEDRKTLWNALVEDSREWKVHPKGKARGRKLGIASAKAIEILRRPD